MKALLRYAVLAPSGPNTQPWKLSIKDNVASLIADLSRSLPSVDPTDRTLHISHGCLLANLLIAAEHFSFGYDVECLPDGNSGNRTAAVHLLKAVEPRFPDLFQEITRRHTNRKRYEDRAIEDEKLQRLKDCINKEGFRLDILTDTQGKNIMADILAEPTKFNWGTEQSLSKGVGILGEAKHF